MPATSPKIGGRSSYTRVSAGVSASASVSVGVSVSAGVSAGVGARCRSVYAETRTSVPMPRFMLAASTGGIAST